MTHFKICLAALLAATLLPRWNCDAQVQLKQARIPSKPDRQLLQQKEVMERHFESTQPRPRPQFGGAVPGNRLLEIRKTRVAEMQLRAHAIPDAGSESTGGAASMPGIGLRPTLPAGEIPTTVVTGDFNQDGHMDMVVANGLENNLWIYLGKGDGTFALPRVIPLSKGLAPVGLAAGDLRKSGKLDLVVAEADSASIGILLGNGDGTFGYEQEYGLPEPPEAVVINDFNHDGRLDIAAVMDTTVEPLSAGVPYLALLTGNGQGSFATPVITSNWGFYSSAWNLDSGDVNGDGLPDLLITGPGIENSQIFLNNGDGTFKAGATVLANGAYDMLLDGRLADVNGDGCLDGVIADAGSAVWIALGDCSGNFKGATFLMMGDSNAAVRVVDVNGDGHPDIVTSALPGVDPSLGMLGGDTLSVAFGDGKGNFGTPRNYVGKSQAYSIGIADFNGDGRPDFVTANNDTDTLTVYQNDGSGGFGFPQGVYAGVPGQGVWDAPFSSLSFADLNNDGKMDAFLVDEGYNGEFYTTSFLNDGTGRFSGPVSSDTGITITDHWVDDYRLGDFRNSGKLDMVSIGFSGATQFIEFNRGNGDGSFAAGVPVAAANADGILATGDFNHDGKLDFVTVCDQPTHKLTMFLGNGDGTFRAQTPQSFTDGTANVPSRIFSGDFNRDGKLDVLIFTTGNGYWTNGSTVWEFDGNGDGTFLPARQLFSDFQPFVLADVNGDSHPDIARYDFMWPGTDTTLGPSRFTNYLGQADGSFSQSNSYTPYSGIPISISPFIQKGDPLNSSLVSDLNGDGKADEIAFQSPVDGATQSYAQILMGNGDGTFAPTYDVFPFYVYQLPLYAYDLNGDGKEELVQVVGATSSLQVFKTPPAPAVQIELQDEVVHGNASCGWVYPNLVSSSSTTVALSSSVPGVLLPSSVIVPANMTGAKFCYTLASNFDWRQVFDVDAQLNGDTATAYATDSYSEGFSVALSPVTPAVLYSGQSTNPVTVTLASSQGYSSTAKLSCAGMAPGDSCQFASNTVSFSAGAPSTTAVTFVLAPDAADHQNTHHFTVVADDGNIIQRSTTSVEVSPLYMNTFGGPIPVSAPGNFQYTVGVMGIAPFALSCSGLPPGALCTFTGGQGSYPETANFTMTLAIPAGLAGGTYPFTINLTSGNQSASQTATLEVFDFEVQVSSSGKNWVLPDYPNTINITASSGIAIAQQAFSISCALDSGGTCSGQAVPTSTTPQNSTISVYPPAGTPAGQHVLTVTASLSPISKSFTFPIYVADYGGSLSTSYLSVARGGSGAVTATLTASAQFSGTIALACSGVSQVTCSFTPASTQLTGGTPQTVSINLTAGALAQSAPAPAGFVSRHMSELAVLLPLGLVFGLRRRRWSAFLMMAIGSVLLLTASSCGSGGGSSGSGGGGGGGSNSYAVTVTASMTGGTVKTLGAVNVTVTH